MRSITVIIIAINVDRIDRQFEYLEMGLAMRAG